MTDVCIHKTITCFYRSHSKYIYVEIISDSGSMQNHVRIVLWEYYSMSKLIKSSGDWRETSRLFFNFSVSLDRSRFRVEGNIYINRVDGKWQQIRKSVSINFCSLQNVMCVTLCSSIVVSGGNAFLLYIQLSITEWERERVNGE